MKCPDCSTADTIGPFEMDGFADGVYQTKGLWWLWCRLCQRHFRVQEPA